MRRVWKGFFINEGWFWDFWDTNPDFKSGVLLKEVLFRKRSRLDSKSKSWQFQWVQLHIQVHPLCRREGNTSRSRTWKLTETALHAVFRFAKETRSQWDQNSNIVYIGLALFLSKFLYQELEVACGQWCRHQCTWPERD